MKTTRDYMLENPTETIGWCRCYRSADDRTTWAHGELGIVSAQRDGQDIDPAEITKEVQDGCHGVGCADCPWIDECEAMDEEIPDLSGRTDWTGYDYSDYDNPDYLEAYCAEELRNYCEGDTDGWRAELLYKYADEAHDMLAAWMDKDPDLREQYSDSQSYIDLKIIPELRMQEERDEQRN